MQRLTSAVKDGLVLAHEDDGDPSGDLACKIIKGKEGGKRQGQQDWRPREAVAEQADRTGRTERAVLEVNLVPQSGRSERRIREDLRHGQN